jgi:N-acetylmuramic acid 6-phosphate etherase
MRILHKIWKKLSMPLDLRNLVTETRNPRSRELDQLSILEILQLINEEDQTVAQAVQKELPVIARVVEEVVASLSGGGRLFLCGAGTSGRLAMAEAAECPPTFSTPPDLVHGIMAGAPKSFFQAVEGAEDSFVNGKRDVQEKITAKDVLIGISASGRTPYMSGAIEYAKEIGASTVLICASRPQESVAQFIIAPNTGPEVLTGSTRMKAATAAKMVLNMITTTSMVCLGKVYGNWMVDLSFNSEKLLDRGVRILKEITGCPENEAIELLKVAGNTKVAAVMYLKKLSKEKALELLWEHKGRLRPILEKNNLCNRVLNSGQSPATEGVTRF